MTDFSFEQMYPDVLGAISSGVRVNIGEVLQIAPGIFPSQAYVNQPVELILLAQNMIDAPVQVAVLNITDAQADYCREIAAKLQKALPNQDLRVVTDLRNEKITYKIREHSLQKLPYILVAGDKEKAAGAVAVRARGNRDLGVMSLEAFAELIAHVATDPATVTRVLPLTSVCRYLERVGDHVKNLAEEVVYMVRATDVRHRPIPQPTN